MKSLLILRHAKSSWSDGTLSDHDRPLNERGKRDAPRVGELLRELSLTPERILCSTAKRAHKTAEKLVKSSGFEQEIVLLPELYLAPPSAYRAALRNLPDTVERAMVVGHNPGLEELLAELTGSSQHLPTAALAHVQLDVPRWSDIDDGTTGRMAGLWRPRDLD
jgi:phosphohistidine phosphatase